jgi:hypothetical protein
MADSTLQGQIETFLKGLPKMQQINPDNPRLSMTQLTFVIQRQLSVLGLAINAHARLVRRFFNNLSWHDDRFERSCQLPTSNCNLRLFNNQLKRILALTVTNNPKDQPSISDPINTNEKVLELAGLLVFNPLERRTHDTDDGIEFATLIVINENLRGPNAPGFYGRSGVLDNPPETSMFTPLALYILEAKFRPGTSMPIRQQWTRDAVTELQTSVLNGWFGWF